MAQPPTPSLADGVADAIGFVGGALAGFWLGQWLGRSAGRLQNHHCLPDHLTLKGKPGSKHLGNLCAGSRLRFRVRQLVCLFLISFTRFGFEGGHSHSARRIAARMLKLAELLEQIRLP